MFLACNSCIDFQYAKQLEIRLTASLTARKIFYEKLTRIGYVNRDVVAIYDIIVYICFAVYVQSKERKRGRW